MAETAISSALRRRKSGGSRPAANRSAFTNLASNVSHVLGSPWAFLGALAVIMGWAVLGPICHYSDTWQLVINTSPTIVTFLMVFLIQHTQNRDAAALRIKVDELIRAVNGARDALIEAEDLDDETLHRLEEEFRRRGSKARRRNGGL